MNGEEQVRCGRIEKALILATHEDRYHSGVVVWMAAKEEKRSAMKEENGNYYAANVDSRSFQ